MGAKNNDWGLDASVRRMRRVFSEMESAQRELLAQLKIPLFDKRLRSVREVAKDLFHSAWSLGAAKDKGLRDEQMAGLYLHCLACALAQVGLKVPLAILPEDEFIRVLVKEASA